MSEWDNNSSFFFRYKKNTHQLHDQDQDQQQHRHSPSKIESEAERERRVAEYWKKAYEPPKNTDLSYEPTAILGKTKKTGKRFSIYEISKIG